MVVQIYMGNYNLVKCSGVGKAIEHQKEMLRQVGVGVTQEGIKEAEIVHINTILPKSVLTAMKAKLQHKHVIYYGHSTEEDFKNSFVGSNFIAPLFKQWLKFCYSKGDIIITPTEYSKSILEGYHLQKPIYALSNGIDTTSFHKSIEKRASFRRKYDIAEDEKVVMSVGHLIDRKGIIEFLELAKYHQNYTFIWFGATPDAMMTGEVKDAIKGATNNVVFAGYVDKTELVEAYCGADLFAFLSKEETEGIVVLEALSCEIPVLVRDIPVYEQWLTNGVNCYKASSQEDFIGKTKQMLDGTLPCLVQEGAEVARNRSMKAVGEKLLHIYKDVIKQG